jgi:hypothetical protein
MPRPLWKIGLRAGLSSGHMTGYCHERHLLHIAATQMAHRSDFPCSLPASEPLITVTYRTRFF